jgi:hypothetical protein
MDLENNACVICGKLIEDGGHLFSNCKFVKQLWTELNLEEQRCLLAGKSSAKGGEVPYPEA